MNPNDVAPVIVSVVVTCAIWSLLMAWIKSRARARSLPPSDELKEIAERLGRMEQAIDAMAVETERISEAQRFTSKLLSEAPKVSQPR
jgi:membrane protein implicated in regulation of membrane protease activity